MEQIVGPGSYQQLREFVRIPLERYEFFGSSSERFKNNTPE